VSDYDDDNIEFDFFEESAPAEPTSRRGLPRRPRKGGDEPPRPPVHLAPGLMPILRLAGLVGGTIVAIVVVVWLLQGCSSSSGAYKSYMDDVSTVAGDSQQLGTQLNGILATPALTEASLEKALNGLVVRSSAQIQDARDIRPPGKLRQQHQEMLSALQMRRIALASLLQTFRQTAKEKKNDSIGQVLSQQVSQRLLASDVIWRDLFAAASLPLLERQAKGVKPPASVILAKPENLDSRSLANLWKRVRATSASSSVTRGTALYGVVIQPLNASLSTTKTTVVKLSTNMHFEVSVKDTGDSQEANVQVTLTILQEPLITLKGRIDVINPGEIKKVSLPWDADPLPIVGSPLKIRVEVAPVPHEARLSNNSADFPVEFAI